MMKFKLEEALRIRDKEFIKNVLARFIKEEVEKAGFRKVVVGISGGVDSALSAFLGVEALGRENVIGISMPYRTSCLLYTSPSPRDS
jgi:NAD+ synthase